MNEKYLNTYNDLILTFPKAGTKFLDSIMNITGALSLYSPIVDESIKFKYVIIKHPLEYFCSSFRNMWYPQREQTSKKEILLKMLSNSDAHYNLGLNSILYTLNTQYKIEYYVDINDLDYLLNEKLNILPFNTQKKDKTFPWYTNDMVIGDIQKEEPYLWDIIRELIEVEVLFYNRIKSLDNFYRVNKGLI